MPEPDAESVSREVAERFCADYMNADEHDFFSPHNLAKYIADVLRPHFQRLAELQSLVETLSDYTSMSSFDFDRKYPDLADVEDARDVLETRIAAALAVAAPGGEVKG